MPEHFLGLRGAATLATRQYQLTGKVINDLVEELAMGVIHGAAGTGKTYAVQAALEDLYSKVAVAQSALSFQSRPTMRQICDELICTITGSPGVGNRFQLTRQLSDLLPGAPRLLVTDEAQRLTGHCLELIRHLHDAKSTRFAVLYVGGDGCWETLSREPMLRSRIYRRLPFQPLSRAAIPSLIGKYHAIYRGVPADLLLGIDDVYAHGNLRDWAVFTHTAAKLCKDVGRDQVDEDVIANAYALLGGGIGD